MELKLIDYIILLLVALLIFGAVKLYKKRSESGCCGGSGSSCTCSEGCSKCKDKK